MNVKENVKNVDVWIRGLFIIIFGVIFYFLYLIIWLLVIIQFFTKVITGELNENLAEFSQTLTQYASQILVYITFQSEQRPFPFNGKKSEGQSLAGSAVEQDTEAGKTGATDPKQD